MKFSLLIFYVIALIPGMYAQTCMPDTFAKWTCISSDVWNKELGTDKYGTDLMKLPSAWKTLMPRYFLKPIYIASAPTPALLEYVNTLRRTFGEDICLISSHMYLWIGWCSSDGKIVSNGKSLRGLHCALVTFAPSILYPTVISLYEDGKWRGETLELKVLLENTLIIFDYAEK